MPALDGLRALAIAGVVAYHLGLGAAPGGYLGVDLFFVLSGFLITSLLLDEHRSSGRIGLGAFWARRARRLLPALLLLLVALAAAAGAGWLVVGTDLSTLRSDGLATLAYVANWHQLFAGQSYFSQFTQPSPLQHTWSLAIEEQFYVVWPLLVVALLWVGRRSGRRSVGAAALGGAALSALWMGWLAGHGASFDRLYYGTDTRAFELLVGAGLAAALAGRAAPDRAADSGGTRRRRLALRHAMGVVAVAGLFALWSTAAGPPRWLFEGGMVLAATVGAVIVADVRDGRGPLARVLEVRPLRYVGRISYGIYLWHWPVITEVTADRVGFGGAGLALLRVCTTLALAAVSFAAVEQPLRRWRAPHWPRPARVVVAPLAFGATALVLVLSTPVVTGAQTVAGSAPTGAAVPGAGGMGAQAPLHVTPAPSTAHPLRVLLLGDSLIQSEAPAVVAALQATGAATVVDQTYPGWSLHNDRGWMSDTRHKLALYQPQLVVATWVWDDQWALTDPSGYRKVLNSFITLLRHPGPGIPAAQGLVLEQFPLFGLPPAGDPGAVNFATRVAGNSAWNRLASSMPAAFPGFVQFAPLGPALEHQGSYSTWLPPLGASGAPVSQWQRVRTVDATHLCPAGAAHYAAALAADLKQSIGLPEPLGRWWAGSWSTTAAVYRQPWEQCPDDHPTS